MFENKHSIPGSPHARPAERHSGLIVSFTVGKVQEAGTGRRQSSDTSAKHNLAGTSREIRKLTEAAFAPSTHRAYEQGVRAFEQFCVALSLPCKWPVPKEHIPHFVAFLSLEGKALATVKNYLAALAAKHKINEWPDPTDTWIVKKLLKGFGRRPASQDARKPITFDRLKEIMAVLTHVCFDTYETTLFRAVYSAAFFGMFRVSELLGQIPAVKGGRPPMQFRDMKLNAPNIELKLRASKTDQEGRGISVVLDRVKNVTVCPVQAMESYVRSRGQAEGNLFLHKNGKPLTVSQFQGVLTKAVTFLQWKPYGFGTHSFRIGAATTAAINKVPEAVIQRKGRWKSNAFKAYLREDLV